MSIQIKSLPHNRLGGKKQMIEKLKGIRIKGRCFKNDTDLLFYKNPNDRISVVFGKTGVEKVQFPKE